MLNPAQYEDSLLINIKIPITAGMACSESFMLCYFTKKEFEFVSYLRTNFMLSLHVVEQEKVL